MHPALLARPRRILSCVRPRRSVHSLGLDVCPYVQTRQRQKVPPRFVCLRAPARPATPHLRGLHGPALGLSGSGTGSGTAAMIGYPKATASHGEQTLVPAPHGAVTTHPPHRNHTTPRARPHHGQPAPAAGLSVSPHFLGLQRGHQTGPVTKCPGQTAAHCPPSDQPRHGPDAALQLA